MFKKDTVKNALKLNVQIIFQWLKKLDERWKKERWKNVSEMDNRIRFVGGFRIGLYNRI